MTKTAYEAPKMEAIGSFETLTQSTHTGNRLDVAFDQNTPLDQLTVS